MTTSSTYNYNPLAYDVYTTAHLNYDAAYCVDSNGVFSRSELEKRIIALEHYVEELYEKLQTIIDMNEATKILLDE